MLQGERYKVHEGGVYKVQGGGVYKVQGPFLGESEIFQTLQNLRIKGFGTGRGLIKLGKLRWEQ